MAKVAYIRVSTANQNTARQDVGDVDKVFEEKVSGKNVKDRQALQDMIEYVREGDEVIVHSIDRLARDLRDLLSIVDTMIAKGVSLHFLKENLTFSGNDDPFSKLTLSIAGAFASFERDIIKSRQAEGIAKAKERGVYKGRQKKIDDAEIYKLTDAGYSQNEIAEQMGITRISVYRALRKRREAQANQ